MKILFDYRKNEVAKRYYAIVHPERDYSGSTQALRQFKQDRNIDLKIVQKVIREIFREQIELLKNEHA